jgi:hypothetical protein
MRPRILVLLLVTASAVAGWVALAGAGAGASNGPRPAQLILERTVGRSGFPELLASVDPGDGVRSPRIGDRLQVHCTDPAGTALLDGQGQLTDDGGSFLPHVHFAMTAAKLGAVAACVATGDGGVLRAAVAR